jgi:hypothetical protein
LPNIIHMRMPPGRHPTHMIHRSSLSSRAGVGPERLRQRPERDPPPNISAIITLHLHSPHPILSPQAQTTQRQRVIIQLRLPLKHQNFSVRKAHVQTDAIVGLFSPLQSHPPTGYQLRRYGVARSLQSRASCYDRLPHSAALYACDT